MNRQSMGTQRSELTTADEIGALDRKWAESKSAAWRPFLKHMEQHLNGKELSPKQLSRRGSQVDLVSVNNEWNRSLLLLGVKYPGSDIKDIPSPKNGRAKDEQSRRVERIRASKDRLENKLKESRRTVERLQRYASKLS
jgi:hypothetical protein